jgi:hypothetical protein
MPIHTRLHIFAQSRDSTASERVLREQLQEAQAQAAEYQSLAAAQQAGVEEARAQLLSAEARAGALGAELAVAQEGAAAASQEVRQQGRWRRGAGASHVAMVTGGGWDVHRRSHQPSLAYLEKCTCQPAPAAVI